MARGMCAEFGSTRVASAASTPIAASREETYRVVGAVHAEGGQACVQVFFFRSHQNWGNRAYFPRAGAQVSEEEILRAFLTQFYGGKTPARLILTSHEVEEAALIAEALSISLGRKVAISRPQRGEKKMLVEFLSP